MATELNVIDLDEALLVNAARRPSFPEVLLSVAAAGVFTVVLAYLFATKPLVRPLAIVAVLMALVYATRTKRFDLRITKVEFVSRGRIGNSLRSTRTVCAADIQWLEYQEDARFDKAHHPRGLYAALENRSICLLPDVDEQQAALIIARIQYRFPELREQWRGRGNSDWLFQQGGQLLPALQQAPTGLLLRQFFDERTRYWRGVDIEVEGGGLDLFCDLPKLLSPEAAFGLIGTAAELVLEASSPDRIEQAGSLLMCLVHRSDTTEMPGRLAELWEQVLEKLRSGREPYDRSCVVELRRWYRRYTEAHHMNETEFDWSDGWLLHAIADADRGGVGGTLPEVIYAGDWIQHAIFTGSELHNGIGRLLRAGYIEVRDSKLFLVPAATETVMERKKKEKYVSGAEKVFQDFLQVREWVRDPNEAITNPEEWPTSADMQAAFEEYPRKKKKRRTKGAPGA